MTSRNLLKIAPCSDSHDIESCALTVLHSRSLLGCMCPLSIPVRSPPPVLRHPRRPCSSLPPGRDAASWAVCGSPWPSTGIATGVRYFGSRHRTPPAEIIAVCRTQFLPKAICQNCRLRGYSAHGRFSRLRDGHRFWQRAVRCRSVPEALAGHVSRQMLERYSHIRSQAKQAAIQTLEQPYIEPILRETGHKNGHSDASANTEAQANLLKTIGGPARI